MTSTQKNRMTARLLGEMEAYAHGHERPLGSFLIIMGAYGAAVTGMAAFLAVSGRRLPDRLTWSDLALVAGGNPQVVPANRQGPGDQPDTGAIYPAMRVPVPRRSWMRRYVGPGCAKRSAS